MRMEIVSTDSALVKHQFALTFTQPSSWSPRLHLLKFLTELTGLTSRNRTISIYQNLQTTTLTALCQRQHHARPRSAACAICAAQVYDPKVC